LTARAARAGVQGANDRIRIGIIGTGGRARGLMNLLKRLPGNEMVAVCDVYEPRMLQAMEIAAHPRRKLLTTAASSTTARSTPW
jgi:predicted homoserine dehydrogenase-like protein